MNYLHQAGKIWMKGVRIIGAFQSKIILTVFYFIFLLPAGIIYTNFKDPLKIKNKTKSTWIVKRFQVDTLEEMGRQY
jgi:hypothetical protein